MRRPAGIQLEQDSVEEHIIEEGFGIPIELGAAPTTSGGELPKHGDAGWFGTNLYLNLGGNVYRFSGTLV